MAGHSNLRSHLKSTLNHIGAMIIGRNGARRNHVRLATVTLVVLISVPAMILLPRAAHSAQLAVPYISQYQGEPDQNCDCGPASVGMVLEYYGIGPGNQTLGNWLIQIRNATGNTSTDCTAADNYPADTSLGNLEQALSYYGLSYSTVPNTLSPAPSAEVQAIQNATNSGQPVIAVIDGYYFGRGTKDGSYGYHFVVVTGFSSDGQTVYLNDSDNQSPKNSGWIQGGQQISVSRSTFSNAVYYGPNGPYGIIVSGGGSGGGPPGAPTLQSPSNGSTQTSRTVTFSWSPPNSPNLNGYTLHVSSSSTIDGSGFQQVVDTGVGGTSYTYTFSQDYSTLWWSVAAWNTAGQRGNWASAWTFAINTAPQGPSPPTLQSPGNGSATNNRTVTFSWSPPNSPNTNGYTLHVSTSSTIDGSGAPLVLDTGVGGTSYSYTFSQDYNELWWSVATWNTSGQRSGFASPWTLTVDTSKPTVTLVAPTNTEWGVGDCNNNVLTLQVNATDNISVSWVDFQRYDTVQSAWVDLGTVYQPVSGNTYQQTLDCSPIPTGYNQMWVGAGDEAGNWSSADFWVDHHPPPVAPTNLSAQAASCSEIDLSWTDNSGGQDGFNIYRNGTVIGQVSAGGTTYADVGLTGGTSYSYGVTATSGSQESSAATTALATPACPPPVTADFTGPVSDGGIAYCQDGMSLTLSATASSSLGISSVQYELWDAITQQVVVLDTAPQAPYTASVNCRTLSYAWNLIYVVATDTSGNQGWNYIWIYLVRPQAGQGPPSTSGNCADVPRGCSG